MWRVTIKGLLAHKLRLVLTALAIVLGVTFIAGTFVLTDTLNRTFDTLFGNIYQNVNFQVRGVAQLGSGGTATRNPVPQSLAACVAYRESTNLQNPAADGNAYGIIPASGYNVYGTSLANQKQVFAELYQQYGGSPWAADGCPGT